MTLFQAAVLGALQGLTEFLPVSSSCHLILLPWLMRWPDPGLTFDVALHLGTLVAVVVYFFHDWVSLLRGALSDPASLNVLAPEAGRSPQGRLFALLVLATVPGGIIGLLLEKYAESAFRSPPLIAATLIAFGLILEAADRWGARRAEMDSLALPQALRIGLGQALAVIPGVSRSGITITVGLWEGLTAEAAAKFSFLLSSPIIMGASLHKLRHLPPGAVDAPFLLGIACSAVTGLAAIGFLMRYLRNSGFRVFTLYRIALGVAVMAVYRLRGG